MATPSINATSILKLPSELLLSIFEAEHSIRDALCLSGTCRKLRSLWIHRHLCITDSILPHEILGYDAALALAEAQAHFKPSRFKKRLDAAQSELHDVNAALKDACSGVERSEEPIEIQESHKRCLIQRVKEARDIIQMYGDMSSLVGNGGQTDGYQLHLRHLRRIYRNAREATSIAELIISSDLRRNARQPRTPESPIEVLRKPCLYHPFDKSLPHEDERAIQCVYYIRSRVLGHFDRALDKRCQESEEAMSSKKLYAIVALCSFVMSTHRKKEARILGIHRPLTYTIGAKDLTPEWRHAEYRMGNTSSKIRARDGSSDTSYLDGRSEILDRCTASDTGAGGICAGTGAGKDLWN